MFVVEAVALLLWTEVKLVYFVLIRRCLVTTIHRICDKTDVLLPLVEVCLLEDVAMGLILLSKQVPVRRIVRVYIPVSDHVVFFLQA